MEKKPKRTSDFIVTKLSTAAADDSVSTLARIGQKMSEGTIGDYTMGAVNSHIVTAWNVIRARKPRPDGLRTLIEGIIANNPKIKSAELLEELRSRIGEGVIESVTDDHIGWRDKNHPAGTSSITGLKDRLSRARKTISSR